MSHDDSQLEQRIKQQLDAEVQQLDHDTRQKLAAIRRQALAQPAPAGFWQRLTPFYPASAMAAGLATVLIVFVTWQFNHSASSNTGENLAFAELMSDPDELDVMVDPGFYVWLEAQETGVDDAV